MANEPQFDANQVAQDESFRNATMADRIAYLSANDPSFASANATDRAGYINHLLGNDIQEAPKEQSTYQKLTALDQTTKNPVARYLSNAGATLIGAPEAMLKTALHLPTAVTGMYNTAVDAAKTYADPATRPTLKGALSVLPEALGQGTGNVAAGEATGLALKGAAAGASAVVPKGVPEYLYRTALKPSTTIPEAKASAMINTGLDYGIPVSKGGLEKLGSLIDDLNDKIAQTVQSRPGATINKYDVASRLGDTQQRFINQVNPSADLKAIQSSGNEFLANQPDQIPATTAQALKQGTYQQLKSRAYGELGTATIESQKALARGIKEELVNAFHELKDLNAEDSKLLNLDPVLERAVNRIGNHQVIGIGTPIAAGAAKAVTGSTGVGAIAGVLKGVFDNPIVKSRIAIALRRQGISPGTAVDRVAAYSSALGAAASAAQNENQGNQ